MRSWPDAISDGVVTGTVASVASTVALALFGRVENGSAAAPTNATSHWLWGERAEHVDAPTLRHTVVGYAIHHAASVFWAVLYEKWLADPRGRRPWGGVVADGAVTAAVACFVDMRLTPRRLTPGFEQRLSRPALLAVYAAFAGGLVAATLARDDARPRSVRSAAPLSSGRPATPRRNARGSAAAP